MNFENVETLLLNIVGIALLTGLVVSAIYTFYLILTLSFAIWFPRLSRKSWSQMLDSPVGHIGYGFYKWGGPILAFLLIVNGIGFVAGVVQ